MSNKCSVFGCGSPHQARSYCHKHYQRWKKYGDPNGCSPLSSNHNEPIIDRIWKRVDKTGKCWIWKGKVSEAGYGYLTINHKKQLVVHRLVYEHFNGKIENSKLQVMHSCDNPSCCNPEHLSLGTAQDNLNDAISKGRFISRKRRKWLEIALKGSNHWNSILKDEDIIYIRNYVKENSSDQKSHVKAKHLMATKYNCSYHNIRDIISRRSWRHLP